MMAEVEAGLEGTKVGGQGYVQQGEVEEEEEVSEEEESPGEAGFVLCCCWFLEGFGFGQCCWAALWLILYVQ